MVDWTIECWVSQSSWFDDWTLGEWLDDLVFRSTVLKNEEEE